MLVCTRGQPFLRVGSASNVRSAVVGMCPAVGGGSRTVFDRGWRAAGSQCEQQTSNSNVASTARLLQQTAGVTSGVDWGERECPISEHFMQ